jgi:hypothetical protein
MTDTSTPSCEISLVSFTISRESPEHPEIVELLKFGAEFANSMHSPHLNFLLNVTELQADGVRVYAAREFQESTFSETGKALGMAAPVPISANLELGKAVEIKRMYVHATSRGRGVGKPL